MVRLVLSFSLPFPFARLADRLSGVDGNVANFVETETVLSFQDTTLSYVQIRGSVPRAFLLNSTQTS
jgi:hypothetical protein